MNEIVVGPPPHIDEAIVDDGIRETQTDVGCTTACGSAAYWLLDKSERTDNALATRFIDAHGEDLRFVPVWRKWLVWDSHRWVIDEGATFVLMKARDFTKSLWTQFEQIAREEHHSPEECRQLVTFVKSANRQSGIRAIIELAKADERVIVSHEMLNADENLLNLQNGTFNCRTGVFRPPSRSDLITQIANVEYDPSATCSAWDTALELIFDGDAELIRYVRQILGYSLIGNCGEHVLPIAYGTGSNGKSFVWNSIVELAGDYALVANDSLLLGEKNSHPTEKASLYQKRIVAVGEPEQGCKMRESRVKELTGDAFITARRCHEDFWTFKRTHTFWLATNHLPRVTGTDEGIWRRIKIIPFAVDLRTKLKPKPDYHLDVLDQEGPGILNWLLAGFEDYRTSGFVEPESVTRVTQDYRQEQDYLAQFVSECCNETPGSMTPSSELFTAFREWGGSWSKTAFGNAMAERYKKDKAKSGPFRDKVVYYGIQLTQSNDDDAVESNWD